jgi:hypothetical protein
MGGERSAAFRGGTEESAAGNPLSLGGSAGRALARHEASKSTDAAASLCMGEGYRESGGESEGER